jgi:hypothetical protein
LTTAKDGAVNDARVASHRLAATHMMTMKKPNADASCVVNASVGVASLKPTRKLLLKMYGENKCREVSFLSKIF